MEPAVLVRLHEGVKAEAATMGYEVRQYRPIQSGIQFEVKKATWVGRVRLYIRRDGSVKLDFSQVDTGPDASTVAEVVARILESISAPVHRPAPDAGYPVIGSDESGKGDYFGPLVTAAVYVDRETAGTLLAAGVADSKTISDERIVPLSEKVARVCGGRLAVVEVAPSRYNELYAQFVREGKNLNLLLAWGHARAIEDVLTRVDCAVVVADQFGDKRLISSKLLERGKKVTLLQMPKGERNLAVAAASVVARSRFLVRLAQLSQRLHVELPKGTSSVAEEVARKLVQSHGQQILGHVAKLHFKTTNRVLPPVGERHE